MADDYSSLVVFEERDNGLLTQPLEEQPSGESQPDKESRDPSNTFTSINLDIYGLPKGRPRASDYEIQLDPLAVLDHLDMAQCLEFEGASFHELKMPPGFMDEYLWLYLW